MFLEKIEKAGLLSFEIIESPSKLNNGIINSNRNNSPDISTWKRVVIQITEIKDRKIISSLYKEAKVQLGVEFDLTFWPKHVIFELDWSFKNID